MSLKKEISLLGVFSITTGAMLSSGIFILPGLAFAKTGPALFLSYLLGGILALIGGLSVIELATAMPKTGGDNYFIQRSLGPLMGTISGFLSWMALSLKSAFAIYGIAEILYALTGMDPTVTALMTCAFFVLLNIFGVKETAVSQVILVAGLLTIIVVYLVAGIPAIRIDRFQTLFREGSGLHPIITSVGFIFVSFGGLLKAAGVSEKVKDTKRDLPLGMLLSMLMVTIIYSLMVIVMTGVLPPDVFASSLTPAADSARSLFGAPGFFFISIASSLALISTANAGIIAASRYPVALSDDNLFPHFASTMNKRFQTPVFSVLLTGSVITGSLFLPLEVLVRAASSVVLTSYLLTNLSVIILHESRISSYQPSFRAPLYPWIQILSMIVFSILIVDLGSQTIEMSLAFLGICILFYLLYGKRHHDGEYALLYLMKRMTDKRLGSGILESELRDILIHRDGQVQDHFDSLIQKAKIVELEDQEMTMHTFFKWAANQLVDVIGLPKQVIYDRFIQRQEESNTAVTPFLAIPHIVTGDSGNMFMMLVRSKTGIRFTDSEPNVHAVFLFGGPTEARDLHLKTLASIGMLVREPDFEPSWMLAPDTQSLRNMMLLNDLKRVNK